MRTSAHAAYQANSVGTAEPARLVLMLYDGALGALRAARQAIVDGSIEEAHTRLVKAQAIVGELAASLDLDAGGAIAERLDALYGFCLRELVRANLTKRSEPLDGVEGVLRDLRDGWARGVLGEDAR